MVTSSDRLSTAHTDASSKQALVNIPPQRARAKPSRRLSLRLRIAGLPQFVVSEFEAYLDCGRLEAGCLLLECRSCGYSQLVAFSCKRRGFCPGCVARRMADTGVHLEQRVLPEAPVRHWICSLPWGLRALLGYDKRLCAGPLRPGPALACQRG